MNYPKNRYTGPKPWLDKEWLYNEYIVKDRSTQDIADEYGCVQNTIQQWLAKFKIKKKVIKRKPRKIKYPEITKEFLEREHLELDKPLRQIAKETGISTDTIKRYCEKFEVDYWFDHHPTKLTEKQKDEVCRLYVEEKLSTNELGKRFNISHRSIKNILEKRDIHIRGFQEAQMVYHHENPIDDLFFDADLLNDMHWNQGMSVKDIAKQIGVSPNAVTRQMHRLGLKTKNSAESKIGLMVGEKHPNWKGGITRLYLLLREFFHTNIAPITAKRDNYTCQLCGATHTILHVHHINTFKDIVFEIIDEHPELSVEDNKQELYNIITKDDRFLDQNNLITFCKDCHLFKIHGYKRRDN